MTARARTSDGVGRWRMAARAALSALSVAAVLAHAGCPIGANDLVPSIGASCQTSEALCGVEHVCRPEGAPPLGLCAPVASFGACDAIDGPPTHAPGRLGEIEDAVEIQVQSAADLERLREVRLLAGQLRVFADGAASATVGNLCPLRTLQRVGDGLAVGDSDLTTLDGLQSLTSVSGGLAVFDNRELVSLSGLENLVEVGARQVEAFTQFHVIIAGNVALPESEITAFEQRIQAANANSLSIVSCGNDGPGCAGEEAQLLNFLVANGLRR